MKTVFGSRKTQAQMRFSVFLFLAALIAGMAGCTGDGYTPSQNLEIRTWYDLDAIRDNLAGNHTLMNDLNSTTPGYAELAGPTANGGEGWQPIGGGYAFMGSFNGQGYEIRDLFINRPYQSAMGLFEYVYVGAIIENLGVVNANVTGNSVGSLAGVNWGTVNNCCSTGTVTCSRDAGGLVGINGGTVSDSYFRGNVIGNISVGGLVGYNFPGAVSNSYYDYDEVLINGEHMITIGALSSEDFDQWLANDKFLDINDSLSQEDGYYVINNVSDFRELLAFGQNATLKFRLTNNLDLGSDPNFYIPYFAGEFDGNGHKISNFSFSFRFVSNVGLLGCLAPGGKVNRLVIENVNVTGVCNVGCLAGYSGGNVSNCHATGNVSAWGDEENRGSVVGGLVGWSWQGDVSDSYFIGNVTGTVHVGGLVGRNWAGSVSNSYSTGNVTGNWGVGGLVGSTSYSGTVSASFWDIQTSGQSTSDGGTGKNTTEMHDIVTFSAAGWSIAAIALNETNPTYIWNIVNNVSYPFLSWQAV